MKRLIQSVLDAQTMSEGVGAIVHRTIGTAALDVLDPFLLLDEFTSEGGREGGGFPDHPHRGFETVTYMIEGRMEHADNKGHRGVIGPGAIQWMTAGRGIVHSEMPANEAGEPIRGLQLWLNLPAARKMSEPRYQELASTEIPEVALKDGGKVRVIAGVFQDVTGAATDIATNPLYLDVHLQPGVTVEIEVPNGHRGFVFGLEGSVSDGATSMSARQIGLLSSEGDLTLAGGDGGARFVVVAARPLNEPVARHGPFVMNTREELVQAFEDFREGRF